MAADDGGLGLVQLGRLAKCLATYHAKRDGCFVAKWVRDYV